MVKVVDKNVKEEEATRTRDDLGEGTQSGQVSGPKEAVTFFFLVSAGLGPFQHRTRQPRVNS